MPVVVYAFGVRNIEELKVADVSEREVSHVSTGVGFTPKILAGNEMPGLASSLKSEMVFW